MRLLSAAVRRPPRGRAARRPPATSLRSTLRAGVASGLLAGALLVPLASGSPQSPRDTSARQVTPARQVAPLPDLSGLAWLWGDTFLAVHDAKNDAAGARDEIDNPRVSLVRAATTPKGVIHRPLSVRWSVRRGPSNDLESAARIPGTRRVLLAESGDDGGPFHRIFLAKLERRRAHIEETVPWPARVSNVEGTAVVRLGGRLAFVYAERNQGRTATWIRWAPLRLHPVRFGTFERARLEVPDSLGTNRPVVAIDIDAGGRVFTAAAYDPDEDNGPFDSGIFSVGRFELGSDGSPEFEPAPTPELLAAARGVKIESLAIRNPAGSAMTLFYGTDDENYGAILRPLRLLGPDGS